MLTNEKISAKYGKPGDITNLNSIQLPFSFYLDWDLSKSVNHIVCHKLIAVQLKKALEEMNSMP